MAAKPTLIVSRVVNSELLPCPGTDLESDLPFRRQAGRAIRKAAFCHDSTNFQSLSQRLLLHGLTRTEALPAALPPPEQHVYN